MNIFLSPSPHLVLNLNQSQGLMPLLSFFFFKGRQVLHRFSPVNLRNLRGSFCIPQFSLHMMCLSPCVYITISNCIKYNVNCGGSISFFFFFCFDR